MPRMFGRCFSFDDELYVFGGTPTDLFLGNMQNQFEPESRWFNATIDDERFIMKLNKQTDGWEPVSCSGAVNLTWGVRHAWMTGKRH